MRLAYQLADLPVEILGRLRSDRVLHSPVPARQPGTNGRPPRHGRQFAHCDPAAWPEPAVTTTTQTTRYGTAVARAWDRLHPRLTHRSAWIGHDGPLPVIEGTLIRLQVDHLPGDRDAGAAAPAVARTESAGPVASLTMFGHLSGVTATSAGHAWAVGETPTAHGITTLIVRWNGTAWKQQPSPNGSLSGVAATSARQAWAVGSTSSGKTLILGWNGKSWRLVPSPRPGTSSSLSGVTAVSVNNAWAVGYYVASGSEKTLILHWNGAAWKRVPSPSPGTGSALSGVAASSASSAWAVGFTASNGTGRTLILGWNGKSWRQVPSPSPGVSFLHGVAATSAGNAWAVGCSTTCSTTSPFMKPLILRWNGKAWRRVPGPTIAGGGALAGVAATSARRAWAVGETGSITTGKTVILRWNGSTWKRVPSPSPGANSGLASTVVISRSNAWAVGGYGITHPKTLIARWNGTTWK